MSTPSARHEPSNTRPCRRRLSTCTAPPQSPLDDSVFLSTPPTYDGHSKLVVPLNSNCLKVTPKSTGLKSLTTGSSEKSKSRKSSKTSDASKTPDRRCSNNSSTNGCAVCRICHGSEFSSPFGRNGRRGDPLISPCNCSGTMGLYHKTCLEQWLSVSNRTKCEICRYQYSVQRSTRPIWHFVINPGETSSRRCLIADLLCYLILSPLAIISTWLCVTGAIHYATNNRDSIELPGLICLAAFLLMTYGVWLFVSCRYHHSLYKEWLKTNMVVTLVNTEVRKEGKPILAEPTATPDAQATAPVEWALESAV